MVTFPMPRAIITCVSCQSVRSHEGRGLSSLCYQRHRRNGTLDLFARKLHQSLAEWLADIDRSDPDACWLWPGSTNEDGYGISWVRPRMHLAHRAVYRHLVGPIPENMTLDHMCHDSKICREGLDCPHRRCVNPAHLVPASRVDNIRRSRANRSTCARGHSQTQDNVYRRDGRTWCRLCRLDGVRRVRRSNRLSAGLRVHTKDNACINNHDLTPENTYVHPRTGHKECQTCRRASGRRYYARRKAAKSAVS